MDYCDWICYPKFLQKEKISGIICCNELWPPSSSSVLIDLSLFNAEGYNHSSATYLDVANEWTNNISDFALNVLLNIMKNVIIYWILLHFWRRRWTGCSKFRKVITVYLGNFSPRYGFHRVWTTVKLLCYNKQYPARDLNLIPLYLENRRRLSQGLFEALTQHF
jgi:hypothetical protein